MYQHSDSFITRSKIAKGTFLGVNIVVGQTLRQHLRNQLYNGARQPRNALMWTTVDPGEKSGSKQGTEHKEARARQAKAEMLSDYLIDNFNSSSHVHANLALVRELASI